MALTLTSKGLRAKAAEMGRDLAKHPSIVSPYVAAGTTAAGSLMLSSLSPGWRTIFGIGSMVGGVALTATGEKQFTRSVGAGLVGAGLFTILRK